MLKKIVVLCFTLFSSVSFSQELNIVFAHGLGGCPQKQGNYYNNLLFANLPHKINGPRFPERDQRREDVSLCQKPETELLNKELQCQGEPTILFGVSRGGATVFTSKADNSNAHKKVIVRIAESPFSSINGLIKNHQLLKWLPAFICKKGIKYFSAPQLDPNGIDPLKAINTYQNDQTPTLLICSESDQLVSWKDTKAIAEALRAVGNNNVHLLILQDGQHANLLHGHEKENALYKNTVEQFIQKYVYKQNGPFPLLVDEYRQSVCEKPESLKHTLMLFFNHHEQTIYLITATVGITALLAYKYAPSLKKSAYLIKDLLNVFKYWNKEPKK